MGSFIDLQLQTQLTSDMNGIVPTSALVLWLPMTEGSGPMLQVNAQTTAVQFDHNFAGVFSVAMYAAGGRPQCFFRPTNRFLFDSLAFFYFFSSLSFFFDQSVLHLTVVQDQSSSGNKAAQLVGTTWTNMYC